MKTLRSSILAFITLFIVTLAFNAKAAVYYWDPENTVAPTSGNLAATWDLTTANWSTSSSQLGAVSLIAWNTTGAAGFCAGTYTGSLTVTVASGVTMGFGGIFNGGLTPPSCYVTIQGTGALSLNAGLQGFDNNLKTGGGVNQTTIIAAPIVGAGSMEPQGHGVLALYGANTFTGGISLVSSSPALHFNNNNSFGNGQLGIIVNGATGPAIFDDAPGNVTFPSAVTFFNGYNNNSLGANNIHFVVPNVGQTITWQGGWNVGAYSAAAGHFTIYQDTNTFMVFNGAFTGTCPLTKNNPGTMVLGAAAGSTGSSTWLVSQGVLMVANTSGSATGSGAITVTGPATVNTGLWGNGIVSGTVALTEGSICATNYLTGGPGKLTTGAQTWSGTVTTNIICISNANTTAGTGWSELSTTANLVNNAGTGAAAMKFQVISMTPLAAAGNIDPTGWTDSQDYSMVIFTNTGATPKITGTGGNNLATIALATNAFTTGSSLSGVFELTTNNIAGTGAIYLDYVHTPVMATTASQRVNAGTTVIFSATNTVTGSILQTATYSWTSNGVTLADGGNVHGSATTNLTLTGVTAANQTTYTVIAANNAGSGSTTGTLTVDTAPAGSVAPASQIIAAGTTGSIITATYANQNSLSQSYQWYKGASALSNGTQTDGTDISGSTSSVLTIGVTVGVTDPDADSYTVQVTDSVNTTTSGNSLFIVADPPTISTITASVQQITNILFSAVITPATATNGATYQWSTGGTNLANNTIVAGALSTNLTLLGASATQLGTYTLVINNTAGSATNSQSWQAPVLASLTVSNDFSSVSSAGVSNSAGSNAYFSVTTSAGTTPLAYQWLLNGLNLSNGGSVSGSTSANLTISTTDAYAGSYDVVVSNPGGTQTSATALLGVFDPPTITGLTNETQPAGTTATFVASVVASGGQSASFQWYNGGVAMTDDGSHIYGSQTSTLSLVSIADADDSSYSLVASNFAGLRTNGATLTVIDPPVINAQPATQSVNDGSPATFNVTLTAGQQVSYQWFYGATALSNGVNLPGGSSVSGSTTPTLIIGLRSVADSGSYSVIITNIAGSVTSGAGVLTVVDVPVIDLTNAVLGAGSNYVDTATLSGGAATSFQWQTNGVNLVDDSLHTFGSQTSTLTIVGALDADAASYMLIAANGNGMVTNTNTLVIIDPPIITSTIGGGISVVSNSTVNFSVSISQGTSPTYQWKLGGVNLSNGSHVSGSTTPNLTILNAVDAYTGDYTVAVSNLAAVPIGDAGVLTVVDKPTISGLVSQSLGAGSNAVFAPTVGGSIATYQWYFGGIALTDNGSHILGSSTTALTVAGLLDADSGSYSLSASNLAGLVSNSVTLAVFDPPIILTQPASTLVGVTTNAVFTVALSQGTAPAYQWYSNGVALVNNSGIVGATAATLTVKSAVLADAASYTVTATNLAGSATSGQAILTVENGIAITTQPTSVNASTGGNATFTVVVSGSSPVYQWQKAGVPLTDDGSHIIGSAAATLSVVGVTVADDASYNVIITNAVSTKTSSTVTLTNYDTPVISTPPASATITEFGANVFTVATSAGTGLTYQWMVNGVNAVNASGRIVGATSANLTVENATVTDAASYTVKVSNPSGANTTSSPAAVLKVNQAVLNFVDGAESYNLGDLNNDDTGQPNHNNGNPWFGNSGAFPFGNTGTDLTVTNSTYGISPFAGSKFFTAFPGAIYGQEWLNLAYRENGSNLYWGGVKFEWYFYDQAGTANATSCEDMAGLAGYVTTYISTNGDFNGSASVPADINELDTGNNQLMIGCAADQSTGYNSAVYQVKSLGISTGTGSYGTLGWFNTSVARSVGWHHARVVVDPTAPNTAGHAKFYVDDMVTPQVATAVGFTLGFNVLEMDVDVAGANGFNLSYDNLNFAAGGDPFVTDQPTNTTVNFGATTGFSVMASGASAITYQWTKNGVNLSNGGVVGGSTSSNLVLTAVSGADAGSYACVTTDSNGSVNSSNATLNVNDPYITAQPVSTEGACGAGSETFSVSASGTSLSYQWKLNGTALTDTATITGSATSSLTLANALESQVGSYTVVVTGTYGQVTSSAGVLTLSNNVAPILTMNGLPAYTNECAGSAFSDPGVTANQQCDGSLTVITSGSVNVAVTGTYILTYTATDSSETNVSLQTVSINRTVAVADTTPPVVTLGASASTNIPCDSAFTDPGATASDTCAGSLVVTESGSVNPNVAGTYVLTYTANDPTGNPASATYTVVIANNVPPVVSIIGSSTVTVECPNSFTDPGATANSACAGSLAVTTNSTVNTSVTGTYIISYSATDPSGNSTTNTRTVIVSDTTAPVVTLGGANTLTVECSGAFTDPGATANDACAGSLAITEVGSVDPNTVGVYVLTYYATDPSGNSGTNNLTVTVSDTTPPTVTLIGLSTITVGQYTSYTDPGATANDACAGSEAVVTNNPVNIAAYGTYTETYTATDPSANTGTAYRTIVVSQAPPPNITNQPSSTTNNAGTSVVFTVGVDGINLSYFWRKNGTNMVESANYIGTTTASLTIANLVHTNEGSYSVIVSNSTSFGPSATAVLTVVDPVIVTNPVSQTIATSSNATFTVVAVGTTPLSYQWYFNHTGTPTPILHATSSSYTVTAATTAKAGSYYCVVTNTVHPSVPATSASAILTVDGNIAITHQPASVTVVNGNPAVFSVTATGQAPLSYQWQEVGVGVISGATASSLTVTNTTPGTYTYQCVITNVVASMTTTNKDGVLKVTADTHAPVITVQYPSSPNAFWTNTQTGTFNGLTSATNTFVIGGKVTDHGLVTGLFMQQTFPATGFTTNLALTEITPGDQTFTNVIPLVPGSNTFTLIATNIGDGATGVTCTPVTRKIFMIAFAPLTVNINTNVGISQCFVTNNPGPAPYGKAYPGASLEQTRPYKIKAVAGPGMLFTNWTDTNNVVLSTSPILSFTMVTNLVLNANFITNPVIAVAGPYNGLYSDTVNGIATASAGALENLVVKTNRTFSGKIISLGQTYTIAGTFNLDGDETNQIPRHGSPTPSTLVVVTHLDWVSDTNFATITGTVSDLALDFTSTLKAKRGYTNAPVAATTNDYTMLIPYGTNDVPGSSPDGYGYLTVTNNAAGLSTLVGKAADGTAIAQAVPLAADGTIPFYAGMYNVVGQPGVGFITGWLDFTSGTPVGTLTWVKDPSAGPASLATYHGGFTSVSDVQSSKYVTTTPMLSLTNASLVISNLGATAETLTYSVLVSNNLVVRTGGATNEVGIYNRVPTLGTVNKATGVITLSIRPTGATVAQKVTMVGAVLQNNTNAGGAFNGSGTGAGQTGSFHLIQP